MAFVLVRFSFFFFYIFIKDVTQCLVCTIHKHFPSSQEEKLIEREREREKERKWMQREEIESERRLRRAQEKE